MVVTEWSDRVTCDNRERAELVPVADYLFRGIKLFNCLCRLTIARILQILPGARTDAVRMHFKRAAFVYSEAA